MHKIHFILEQKQQISLNLCGMFLKKGESIIYLSYNSVLQNSKKFTNTLLIDMVQTQK